MARHSTGRLRLAVLLVTLMSLLMLPLQASAAPRGSGLEPEIDSVVPVVSPGGIVPITAEFVNPGPSTLNHIIFVGKATGAIFIDDEDERCEGSGGEVACEVGQLLKDGSIVLTMYFEAHPGVEEVKFAGDFLSDPRKAKRGARVDTWGDDAFVEVNSNSNFFASWIRGNSAGQTLGGVTDESQEGTVAAIDEEESGYFALIEQTGDPVTCSYIPEFADTEFGDALVVTVNEGQTGVEVTLRYRIAGIPELSALHNDPDIDLLDEVRFVHIDGEDCEEIFPESIGIVEIEGEDWLVVVLREPTNGVFKGF